MVAVRENPDLLGPSSGSSSGLVATHAGLDRDEGVIATVDDQGRGSEPFQVVAGVVVAPGAQLGPGPVVDGKVSHGGIPRLVLEGGDDASPLVRAASGAHRLPLWLRVSNDDLADVVGAQ